MNHQEESATLSWLDEELQATGSHCSLHELANLQRPVTVQLGQCEKPLVVRITSQTSRISSQHGLSRVKPDLSGPSKTLFQSGPCGSKLLKVANTPQFNSLDLYRPMKLSLFFSSFHTLYLTPLLPLVIAAPSSPLAHLFYSLTLL